MSDINVMDASAILALLQAGKGYEAVTTAMLERSSAISAVNYCEVIGKLREKGMPADDAERSVSDLQLRLIDFDQAAAIEAGELRVKTKGIGASLGDRACLALAARFLEAGDTPHVVTAERNWEKVSWPFKIHNIR